MIGFTKASIKGMVTSGGRTLDSSKLINLIISGSLWVYEAVGDMLTSIVSNSDFGKRLGARDMTIFGTHFLFHFTNKVFFDRCNFRISGPRLSPELFFGIVLLPCG